MSQQREWVEENIYQTRRALAARRRAQYRTANPGALPDPHWPQKDTPWPEKHPREAAKFIRSALRRGRCEEARSVLRELQIALYAARWHDAPVSTIRRVLRGIEPKVARACRR